MAKQPNLWDQLILFPLGMKAKPVHPVQPNVNGDADALQDHRAGIAQGTNTTARTAASDTPASGRDESLLEGTESEPHAVATDSDRPRQPFEPNGKRGVGNGDRGIAASFANRTSTGRNLSTRPTGKSHIARLNASRPGLFDLPPPRPAVDISQPAVSPDPIPLSPRQDAAVTDAAVQGSIIATGEKAKARDILAAIRTLKNVEQQSRPATADEQLVLSRFCGFGPVALGIFPDPVTGSYKDASWQRLGDELKSLLTPMEYDSVKRTTFNAFYTSPLVITAMHQALGQLGVPADATVLEPGCGSGNFMRYAPAGFRFIGVELDSVSGRIARALHPHQDIRIEDFQNSRLPQDGLDAVIGNVPFADLKLDYHGQRLALHDYFFAKSIDSLKPAGVMALVTSRFTLDKQNAAVREYLAQRADFAGAIRLPSDAFKREGTAVVTDILFFRKRGKDEPANHVDAEWLGVAPLAIDGADRIINRYFHQHPQMILGTLTCKDTLYGSDGYSVVSNGDLAVQLQQAIGRLPRFAACPPSRPEEPRAPSASLPAFTPPPPLRHINEGSFFVRDDRAIYQLQDGRAAAVVYGGTALTTVGTMVGKRLAALVRLRDLARRVLQSQNEGWPDSSRDDARQDLVYSYDRFVLAYGPVNKTTFSTAGDGTSVRRMPNLAKFREDPDAMLVMSLEEYDEETGKADKAAILLRDVVGKTPPVSHVGSAEEGLLVSLNQQGVVDLPLIATLYDKPEPQIIAELGDLIFLDPETKYWQTADVYLSGNVKSKLVFADNAGPDYARNAEALRRVQPPDVLPGDIDANLGAPWIPTEDIASFASGLFHVEPNQVPVAHLPKEAVWSFEATYSAKVSVGATSEFGTARANGTWLLELALNMKTPTIYDTITVGDQEERVVNQEQTLAAREKQKLIKEQFRGWVFADPDRAERLVRRYNDTYNNLRPRLFDGSHLDFPGMNQALSLRPHQKNAVWRGMSSGNTLMAHVVGAGKTFTMAATGMKMKQAGLIKKPMYVVPNHLLEQFSREFMQLYPNAHLLVTGKEDLTRDRRKLLTAKIASGQWDGVIVTHSGFERVGMSRDYQEQFLRQQIAEYDALLIEHASARGSSRNLIKTIEKQKAARAERLKNLLASEKKDDGLVFDELGIDHIFVDEAHYFKNLETPTKMERVAGIQTGGSERAFDLFMKARFMDRLHAGHGVTFATGTPISNTMVEMYTMQRFLDPQGLASRSLEHFDAWAATFGEVVETMEISPDGGSLRPRSRFARFTNLPELGQMFRSFSDVQTAEMLNLPRPRLQGGKPVVISCPMSEEQSRLQQELVERYERLRSGGVDPREDNALAITTDGRKLATDARMLAPEAEDFAESKVNRLVEQVVRVWTDTAASRGAQMIFSDMGVNPTVWGYSPYAEIITKLLSSGIPREQIAAIGDADTDAKKQVLFEKVRSGSVRVLIGSTQKMGTGTNVQKRLVALHHLDAPWKPAEVEQRDGRILRQGNQNEEVSIYRYVTEGSFDAYMWQALETKARFISQVITGNNTARHAEDIGGQELSYAEVKAIASGNPAVLTLAEADAELQRLGLLAKNHLDEQFVARRSVRNLPEVITAQQEYLTKLLADHATAQANAGQQIVIAGQVCSPRDLHAMLGGQLDAMPGQVRETTDVQIGRYRGLGFGMVLRPGFPPDVYLEGATKRTSLLSSQHPGPRAVLNAVERLADEYGPECNRARQNIAIHQGQVRDYQSQLGKRFPHEAYIAQLTRLRDQLRAGLSGKVSGADQPAVPSVPELVEQIKSLKANQTVEATPQRVPDRHTDAEESVVTRIHRQAKLHSAPAAKVDESADPLPHSSPGSLKHTATSFQEVSPAVPSDASSRSISFSPQLRR
jgi:N12 class adenine-specific DNA methylase